MGGYDIIGDIHGSGDKLRGLLDQLGWTERTGGARQHSDPERQVIFVGDLIDRGEDHRGVLATVRSMVDDGTALVVMGNHEFNAVSYVTELPDRPCCHARPHSKKNTDQHREFLNQFGDDARAEWIDWFRGLPIWLDLGEIRVVHACWHQKSVDFLQAAFGGNRFPDDVESFVRANEKDDPIWKAIEVLLKGPELELARYGLPNYLDKGCHERSAARVRWWNGGATTIGDLIDIPHGTRQLDLSDYPPIPCDDADLSFAYDGEVPVFWLN